jgi:hypothetical protein
MTKKLLKSPVPITYWALLLVAAWGISSSQMKARPTQPAFVTDWQLLKEVNGLKAYYLQTTCSGQAGIYFKIINSGTQEKKIVWNAFLQKGEESICVLPSAMMPVTLGIGEEVSSNCNTTSPMLTIPLKEAVSISNLTFNLIELQ